MKIKFYHVLIVPFFVLLSCNSKTTESKVDDQSDVTMSNGWSNKYDKLEATDIPDNIIQLISQDWMLVTAGNEGSYNPMTASWGAMGYVWERPASFIFIRDTRYTYEYLEREDSFTLSFFAEEYRGALRICGTKSGRDGDKVKEAGLTPITTPSGLKSFDEARLIVECKKMYVNPLNTEHFTDNYKSTLIDNHYKTETAGHTLFISEIVNVWMKK